MKKKSLNLYNVVLFLILIVLIALIACIAPNFLKPKYLIGVAFRNIIELGLLALPTTLLMISGGIDFSVGSTMILTVLLSGLAADKLGEAWGLPVAILVGVAAGLFNGLLVVKAKIPAMVATMSAHFLFTGLGRVTTSTDGVYAFPAAVTLGTTQVAGIPIQILVFLVLTALFFYVLKYTTLGRKIYAIGLNRNSAQFSGINIDAISIGLYTLTGVVGSLAGMIYLGRFATIKYNADPSINMNVMTIVILGGTSIAGGKGDMIGTLIGTLIIATLNSGLTVLNIPIAMQMIVRGIVFIIALTVGTYMETREKITKK